MPHDDLGLVNDKIVSVVRTTGSGIPGQTDTYTITLRSGSTYTFNVTNGSVGGSLCFAKTGVHSLADLKSWLWNNEINFEKVVKVFATWKNGHDDILADVVMTSPNITGYSSTLGKMVDPTSGSFIDPDEIVDVEGNNGEYWIIYLNDVSPTESFVPVGRTIAGIGLENNISTNALFDRMNIKGEYYSLADLKDANPNHDYIYSVTTDKHWYYWKPSINDWADGGEYLPKIESGRVDANEINIKALSSFLGCEVFDGFEEINGEVSDGSITGDIGQPINIGTQTSWKHVVVDIDRDFYIVLFETTANTDNVNPYVIFTDNDGIIVGTACDGKRLGGKVYKSLVSVPTGATKMYVRSIFGQYSMEVPLAYPRVYYGSLKDNFKNFGYEKTDNLFYFTKNENLIGSEYSIIFEGSRIIVNGTISSNMEFPIMGKTSTTQNQGVSGKTLAFTVIRRGTTVGGNSTIRGTSNYSNSVQTFANDTYFFVRLNAGTYTNYIVEYMIQEATETSDLFIQRYTLIDYIARKQIREVEIKAKNDNIIENTDNLFYFTSPKDIVGDGYTIKFTREGIITVNGTIPSSIDFGIMGKSSTEAQNVANKTLAITRFFEGSTSGGNITLRKYPDNGISNSVQSFTEDTILWVRVNAGTYSNLTAKFMVQEADHLSLVYYERKTAIDYVARNEIEEMKKDKAQVPSYYVTHIETKAAYINDLLNYNVHSTVTKKANNVEQFIFFTDYHYDNSGSTLDNTQNSAALMEYLDKNIGLTFICHGGDIINNQNNQANTFKYIGEFKNQFRNLKEKLLCCIGNHEYDQSNYLSYAQISQFLNGYQELKMGDLSDYGDYYIINKATKTVYFFMGCDRRTTGGRMMNDNQIAWFLTVLGEIPNNYDVILFAHYLINITYDTTNQEIVPEPSATDGVAIVGAIDAFNSRSTTVFNGVTYDYSNKTGTFICAFTGHSHTDLSYITSGGTPIIMTTTDCCPKRNTSYNWSTNSWNKESVAGTIEEQAFDVVTIDKQNKKIYCTRIGYGNNREFDY